MRNPRLGGVAPHSPRSRRAALEYLPFGAGEPGAETFPTFSLSLIVAIFTFMLYAGAMVSANLTRGFSRFPPAWGRTFSSSLRAKARRSKAFFFARIPRPSTSRRDARRRAQGSGVAQASGQLFISSLDAQCCTVKVQLIGIDQESDFVVAPWLRTQVERPLVGNEVIVGDYIFGQIGSKIKFYDQEFTIVGRLEPTGWALTRPSS